MCIKEKGQARRELKFICSEHILQYRDVNFRIFFGNAAHVTIDF